MWTKNKISKGIKTEKDPFSITLTEGTKHHNANNNKKSSEMLHFFHLESLDTTIMMMMSQMILKGKGKSVRNMHRKHKNSFSHSFLSVSQGKGKQDNLGYKRRK